MAARASGGFDACATNTVRCSNAPMETHLVTADVSMAMEQMKTSAEIQTSLELQAV